MSTERPTYWQSCKEWTLRLWEWVKNLCLPLWHRCSEWYLAQQEVVKRQSEVSHERITVKRAVLSFMETWGLGSRNIFYTMWHLIWRPGYMMNDYLNGRRKRYLQPFFMFFVLTLILVQMAWVLNVQLPKNRDMTMEVFDLMSKHSDWFSVQQIEVMRQAVEDHRASASRAPRNIYGKIVAEADRDLQPDSVFRRTVQFGLDHYPEKTHEEHWQRFLEHMQQKYSTAGYIKLWIQGSDNERNLSELRSIINNRQQLRQIFETIYKELTPDH